MSDADKPKKKVINVSHEDDAIDSKPPKDKESLVTNRSILKDSEKDEEKSGPVQPEELTTKPKGVKLEPISEPDNKDNPANQSPAESQPPTAKTDGPEEAEKPAVKAEEATDHNDKSEETPAKPERDEQAGTGDSISEPPNDTPDKLSKVEEEAAAKQAEHEAEIEKLVSSGKYVLPINTVEKRRTKRNLVIGIIVSIVLALAWLNIALDAGLVNIGGLKPVTHFFSS